MGRIDFNLGRRVGAWENVSLLWAVKIQRISCLAHEAVQQ